MAALLPAQAVLLSLSCAETLTVATGKDILTVPFDCEIYMAHLRIGVTGTTSGNNNVNVVYTKPAGGVSVSGTLWTPVATSLASIAYNAAAKYQEWTRDNMLLTFLEAGGTLSLDVASIATAPSALVLDLYVIPINAS